MKGYLPMEYLLLARACELSDREAGRSLVVALPACFTPKHSQTLCFWLLTVVLSLYFVYTTILEKLL